MDLNRQETAVLAQLNQLVNHGNSVQSAADSLRVMLQNDDLVDRVLAERQAIIEARSRLDFNRALLDAEDIVPWYAGPTASDRFWPKLQDHLLADPDWVNAVASLDETSSTIVSMLADPHSPMIATRGLVVGYVQSGKTANFTATMAKAADAGYRLFIVLSGVHNSLRRQTQIRLDEQLAELNPTLWLSLTDEFQDFGNPVKALPLIAGSDLRLVAVVKKNVSRLARLRKWLEKANEQGGLDHCPVLIIDDEADQASVNSHKDPELDRTRINEELVALLKLPRVAYVGYTATPFANVLANPADSSDIFPRTFIYALPKPTGYFGAEELFAPGESEDEFGSAIGDVEHDMIRFVSSDEALEYVVKSKEPFESKVTDSMLASVRWFAMATAARRVRSGQTKHSSMLIHTTARIRPQLELVEVLKLALPELAAELEGDSLSLWRDLWESETSREPAETHGETAVEFSKLLPELRKTLADTKVVADNSASDDRLLYSKDPATVIAVGGNTLSRGLTLHGLVSSFFLRTASTYDSVLQMGRWFGYRPGYADLPRIWTTRGLADDFRFLAEVEADIRKDIDRYVEGHMKPTELAVRILLHPRMAATSRLKMHFAVRASASYSEHRPQTTYFNRHDPKLAEHNLAAVRTFLGGLESKPTKTKNSFVTIRDVEASSVLEFLREFRIDEASDMSDDTMLAYILDQIAHDSLAEWNVAVVTRQESKADVDLGLAKRTNLITRSRLNSSPSDSTANIGTLMSRQDRLADLEASGLSVENSDAEIQSARNELGRALLLIYPIDKDSKPKSTAKLRSDLGAQEHLIGLAIVFPKAADGTVKPDKIQVDLSAFSSDEEEEAQDQGQYIDSEGSRDEVQLDA